MMFTDSWCLVSFRQYQHKVLEISSSGSVVFAVVRRKVHGPVHIAPLMVQVT